jgi:hypothetical protein
LVVVREKKYGREKQEYVPAKQKTGVLEVLVVVQEKKYGREKQEYVPARQETGVQKLVEVK